MKNKIILYDLSGKNNIRFSPPCWNVKLCLIHNKIDFDTIPIRFTEKEKISFSNQILVPIIKYNEEIISYVLSVEPLSTIIISLTQIVWFKTELIALLSNSHLLYVGITIDMSAIFLIFDINNIFVLRPFIKTF